MSIVGDGQVMGRLESALSHEGGEVIRVPAEFVALAVMGMATLLVPSTCASPVELMLTSVVFPEVQVTELEMTWVLLSLYVPVAVYCSVALRPSETLAGVTAMESRIGAVTVRVVEPTTVPEVAEIVVVPIAKLEAKPPAVIVAYAGVLDAHVAVLVRFCVLPSEYVPVAVYCCV